MADVGVRAARREDVAAVTGTQIRAWKFGYREFLPEGPLEQMTGPAAESESSAGPKGATPAAGKGQAPSRQQRPATTRSQPRKKRK